MATSSDCSSGSGVNVANCGSNVVFNIGCCDGENVGGQSPNGIITGPDGEGGIIAYCDGTGNVYVEWASKVDADVDIYRNGTLLDTVSGGFYTDTGQTTGINDYRVCLTGTTECATVSIDLDNDCTAVTLDLNANCGPNGGVSLTWTDTGAVSYTIERDGEIVYNGGHLSAFEDGLDSSYTHGSHTWDITDSDGNTDSVTFDSTSCDGQCAPSECVFAFTDDWRNEALGARGEEIHETPGASEGVTYDILTDTVTVDTAGYDCISGFINASGAQDDLPTASYYQHGYADIISYSMTATTVTISWKADRATGAPNGGIRYRRLVAIKLGNCSS